MTASEQFAPLLLRSWRPQSSADTLQMAELARKDSPRSVQKTTPQRSMPYERYARRLQRPGDVPFLWMNTTADLAHVAQTFKRYSEMMDMFQQRTRRWWAELKADIASALREELACS